MNSIRFVVRILRGQVLLPEELPRRYVCGLRRLNILWRHKHIHQLFFLQHALRYDVLQPAVWRLDFLPGCALQELQQLGERILLRLPMLFTKEVLLSPVWLVLGELDVSVLDGPSLIHPEDRSLKTLQNALFLTFLACSCSADSWRHVSLRRLV